MVITSQPNDRYEREAESLNAAFDRGQAGSVRELELRPTGLPATGVPGYLRGRSVGEPLPVDVRGRWERETSAALRSVRVHSDAGAHDSAGALDADAYSFGAHIVTSTSSRDVLDHELAHVMLHGGGPVTRMPKGESPSKLLPSLPELGASSSHEYTGLFVSVDFEVSGTELSQSEVEEIASFVEQVVALELLGELSSVAHASRTGSESSNLELSARRAAVAAEQLVAQGFPVDQIRVVVGLGEMEALQSGVPDGTETDHSRRADVFYNATPARHGSSSEPAPSVPFLVPEPAPVPSGSRVQQDGPTHFLEAVPGWGNSSAESFEADMDNLDVRESIPGTIAMVVCTPTWCLMKAAFRGVFQPRWQYDPPPNLE